VSAFPAGYRQVQGLRRKGVSLLCIMLASAMAMGILVYVDSYSVHEWDRQMESVGSVAMFVDGNGINVEDYFSSISTIAGVTKAVTLEYVNTQIKRIPSGPNAYGESGKVVAFSSEYLATFPNRFILANGSFPEDDKSVALAASSARQLGVTVGDRVNYTIGILSPNEINQHYAVLEVVGIFETEPDYESIMYGVYAGPVAVVNQQLLNPRDKSVEVQLDINRNTLNPFNVQASLAYLSNIHEEIMTLDPSYSSLHFSRFNINDYLDDAIIGYSSWLTGTRMTQLERASGTLLLVALAMFLAIRHNMNEKRYENSILMARGASKSDIEKRDMKEILKLSVLGTTIGLAVGVLLSRIGLAANGYFQFNPALFFTEPFLISIESVITAVAIGMLLPIMTWVVYNVLYSTKRRIDESTGKLEKAARLFAFIRWDLTVFLLSAVFLLGLLSTGQLLTYAPMFSFIASIVPLAMFVSLGSLTIKALRRGANNISHAMNHIVGVLPSCIGVRRVGKSASSAGLVVVVLVLSISIAWTYAVVGASMPITKENQAKFAFGGDVAFHLGSYPTPLWNTFVSNVSSNPYCVSSTMVYSRQVYLAAGSLDRAYLIGMDPQEFKYVGYDQWGTPLNESAISPMMSTLANTPSGAIVTADIAATYDLRIGDTIRAFSDFYPDSQQIFAFTIIGIADVLANSELTNTGTGGSYGSSMSNGEVGSSTIWVNKQYLGTLMSLANETDNILCVRTRQGVNGTELVEDVLEAGGSKVISSSSGWAAVSHEVDLYTTSDSYRIDRAADTMLSVSSSAVILAAFIIYAFESLDARRREIALVRAMGGERRVVLKAQVAEMAVLILAAIALLSFYGPLSIMNALIGYRSSSYTFPVSVYPVVPTITMLTIFLFFIGTAIIFVMLVAALSSHVKLAESLNASWAESGPYGGDV
jgi:predicted lysophospholipase L1 biosynthesis ABC-type transport system permease subunit